MTLDLRAQFRAGVKVYQVDPDASSGSYFYAAGWITDAQAPAGSAPAVTVAHWPAHGATFQVDSRFANCWPLPQTLSRKTDLGDSIMTAVVIAPLAGYRVRFTDLASLRLQECERVVALRTELAKCGAHVVEKGDTLEVFPSDLHGAEIETYADHRMAMCFAILGLKVPGIRIKNPACVKKTFPNFFQKCAAPPPHGLGAQMLDVRTGQALRSQDLFAD
jgi:3-phosphoshikimate 1-carboxyvinyltransferase